MSLLKDFRVGIDLYGFETVMLKIVPHLFVQGIRRKMTGWNAASKYDEAERVEAFDITYGTDTSQAVELRDLEFEDPEAIRYHATPVSVLEAAFGALPIHKPDFTFIDLGCGKGRTLLIAARCFKRVLGVEYSKKLVAIAESNRAAFAERQPALAPVEIVESDIKDFEFPNEDQVVFTYESYWGAPMIDCLRRLNENRLRCQKRCWFIWVTRIPMVPLAMRKAPFLHLRGRSPAIRDDWYVYTFECVSPS